MKSRLARIIVVLEGGLIQDMEGIPPGVEVEVRDYDVEGAIGEKLCRDADGEKYAVSLWREEMLSGPICESMAVDVKEVGAYIMPPGTYEGRWKGKKVGVAGKWEIKTQDSSPPGGCPCVVEVDVSGWVTVRARAETVNAFCVKRHVGHRKERA